MTKKLQRQLEKEQRLLGYRILAGTITQEDQDRLAELRELLCRTPDKAVEERTE